MAKLSSSRGWSKWLANFKQLCYDGFGLVSELLIITLREPTTEN